MKKKLVVLLAVVMMFAFSASAYAATFSDVSERPVVEQDAIAKAVALGIIEGYEDGTFGPDKTITRAEFAKIAVTAAGAKETATMLEANASAFKDVRANSWYTGWINAAESLGIFKGDTNGNFRPNDTISNQEAITVMMRLLGYNDNLTGTWPVNYVTKANQIGIMDDVSIVASAAAKRGDVVVMLGEALDTPIVTYDKDTNEFVYKQTTKSGSSYITLLDDSFEGSYLDVNKFNKIDQVRNVADKTLNWDVGDVRNIKTITDTMNNTKTIDTVDQYNGNMIIDENTAVSYNATDLFDLENHQGKVYYVTENDKRYARFIEVESYTQRVSDRPTIDGSKVKVNTTNYNAVTGVQQDTKGSKNSGYYMYFNDDDQVYLIKSDREFTERSFYVKSITTSSARLIGNDAEGTLSKTVNMNDADTLIYDDGKFIAPSDLEAGDAIMEIREGELYAKVEDASGDFTRTTQTGSATTLFQYKAMLGGTNYVYKNSANELTGDNTPYPLFYEENLDDAGISADDVYNNNVRYLLNKDNSVSAIIVDETSTGTTLYGVVVDGGGNNGTWAKSMNSITLYTQEGYTVTYDFDDKATGKPTDGQALTYMGQLVRYKLNSDGEIKTFGRVGAQKLADGTETGYVGYAFAEGEISVKNNAYLVDTNGTQASMAANAIIFEVDLDEGDVDPSLVTRSSLLSGGDFTPRTFEKETDPMNVNGSPQDLPGYAVYDVNANGAIKVLAYTSASGTNYHYGVIKAWKFTDVDHAGNGDYAVTFVGDDKVYDLDNASEPSSADSFVVYKLSGDKVTVKYSFKNDSNLTGYTREVTGFNDGLITVADGWISGSMANKTTIDDSYEITKAGVVSHRTGETIYNIMTDANTVVYVLDSNSGDYREGALDDISRNSNVYIPVVDDDGYAECVLVDEYPHGTTGSSTPGSPRTNVDLIVQDGGTPVQNSFGISVTPTTVTSNTRLSVIVPKDILAANGGEYRSYNVTVAIAGYGPVTQNSDGTFTIPSTYTSGTVTVTVNLNAKN